MTYCDFGYYKNGYYGNLIGEEDFMRIAKRATDKINSITFWRMKFDELSEEIKTRVKDATCALADKMYDNELSNTAIREVGGAGVSSVSSGSESISFGNSATISNTVELDRVYYSIVREYLTGTGLLYAGI